MEQLKVNIKKNQSMVRKQAPITIGSRGYCKVKERMERVCNKLKGKY
ncbi:MAG: hypothetical protein WBL93_06500 [Lutisporaceae bacterium]